MTDHDSPIDGPFGGSLAENDGEFCRKITTRQYRTWQKRQSEMSQRVTEYAGSATPAGNDLSERTRITEQ